MRCRMAGGRESPWELITLGIVLWSRESSWELFSAPAALMHVWYAGGALAIVLHTGDLTAAYFGKGWKNI